VSSQECLRRLARWAIFTLELANSTRTEVRTFLKLQKWCELHRLDEESQKRPDSPPFRSGPCLSVLLDMLYSQVAQVQQRPCHEVVLEVVQMSCDPSMLMRSLPPLELSV